MITALEQPELRFRLPGTWYPIDVSSSAAVEASARAMAEDLAGSGDESAAVRIRLREQVRRAVEAGRDGALRAMLLATELTKGVALPVTLTVYEPERLRVAPAVGTAPEVVATSLRRALEAIRLDGIDEAVDLDFGAFCAIRRARIDAATWSPTALDPDGHDRDAQRDYPFAYEPEAVAEAEQATMRRLVVDYWCTVPESKQVLVVVLSTPLGDISATMVRFFDSILGAAYFTAGRAEAEPTRVG